MEEIKIRVSQTHDPPTTGRARGPSSWAFVTSARLNAGIRPSPAPGVGAAAQVLAAPPIEVPLQRPITPVSPPAHAGRVLLTAPAVVRPSRRGRIVGALLLADLIALVSIVPVAIWIAGIFRPTPGPGLAERPAAFILAAAAIVVLATFGHYQHRRRISQTMTAGFPRVFQAMSLLGFVTLLFLHALDLEDVAILDGEVFVFCLLALIAVPIARAVTRRVVVPLVAGRQRTIILGAGWVGQDVARKLLANTGSDLEIVGFVDTDPHPLADDVQHVPLLGAEEDLIEIIKTNGADRVIVTFSRMTPEWLVDIMRWSDLHRIHLTMVPRFFEVMTTNVEVDDIRGMPVLDLCPARLSHPALVAKRVTDLTLTFLALPILVPLFAVLALAIKRDSPGPVFFRQARIGRGSRRFDIFKFRTMVVDAEQRRDELLSKNEVTGPLFKIRDDPRVTRVGRFLRRTSLDELPQLINVVRGEMSLVGPRPFVVYEDVVITGWARRRLDLTPGITGVWQVMGRSDMSFEEMVKVDYLYVTRWSLAWDLKILARTIPVVLRRRGAY
jgi:exopolysaccharide biosynthesis polyprenyl glycosylphosphotransferase